MAPTYPPTVAVTTKSDAFPTAAIVVLAVGGYMILFVVALIIRKCIMTKGGTCFPPWCTEGCLCKSCCATTDEPGCITKCAEVCNWSVPNKQQCMDSCCPTKQWCDDAFCCCMSQQPQGECCKCNDCGCGECGDCFDCPECKDCGEDCKCECCAQPETIDCCCIEVKLAGSNNRAQENTNQPGYVNQGGYADQQGGYINQQPGYMQPPGGVHVGQPSSFYPGQSGSYPSSGQTMSQPPLTYSQPWSGPPGGSRHMSSDMGMSGRGGMSHSSLNNMSSNPGSNMFQARSANPVT